MKRSIFWGSISILDDEETCRFITNKVIVDNAILTESVRLYSDGLTLLKDLERNSSNPELLPELLFLDIQMPIINGFQFLEQLALLPNTVVNKVKVVLLSSNLRSAVTDRLIEKGTIVAFFNKPLTKDNLHEIHAITKKKGQRN